MKTTLPRLVVAAVCIAAPFRPGSMLAQAPPGQPQLAAPTAPLLSPDQLQNLVGRIALYPDDLLGLVLPAATTPLDIVKGQHFLEKYKHDKSLKPEPSLAQPVVSLLAYPEVVNLMGDDLDWTEALGQAVLAQQADVLQAIQIFRRKAQDAGNLKTDDKQVVVEQQDAVKIIPAKPEVIYVPQYQPSAAVVQQSVPAVTYSSTAYPSYYHPGATAAAAATGYMAGAATAYGLNWGAGAVYNAPYASQSYYNQQQRQNYASQSQQSWQNYSSRHKRSDKMRLLKTKARASRHLLPTRRNASSPPVASNLRRGQTRHNVSSPRSKPLLEIKRSGRMPRRAPSLRRNKARRNASSPSAAPNLKWGPTKRNVRARPARNKDSVKRHRVRNIGRAAVQVARADKVLGLDPVRPDSLARANLVEDGRVAHSAACRRALDRKASASVADRACRA